MLMAALMFRKSQNTVGSIGQLGARDLIVRKESSLLYSKELKTNLFSYHIVNFAAGHFQLNVSPFCLPEVRLQMVGSSLVVGLKISAISGDRFYMEEFYVMRSPVLSDLNAWQRS